MEYVTHRDLLPQFGAVLYLIIVVILGFALPLWTVIPSDVSYTPVLVFYAYMHIVAIAFLLYALLYLRKRCYIKISKRWKRKHGESTKAVEGDFDTPTDTDKPKETTLTREVCTLAEDDQEACDEDRDEPVREEGLMEQLRREMTSGQGTAGQTNVFLRLGAFVFGTANIMFCVFRILMSFGLPNEFRICSEPMYMITTTLNMIMTGLQTYFIFKNSQVCFNAQPAIARFGIMHLIASNLNSWIGILILETLETFHEFQHEKHSENHSSHSGGNGTTGTYTYPTTTTVLSGRDPSTVGMKNEQPMVEYCDPELAILSSYLFPFMVEYSLICAGVLYHMYSRVGATQYQHDNIEGQNLSPSNKNMSEKLMHIIKGNKKSGCYKSHIGVFFGFLMALVAVMNIIVFYIYSRRPTDFGMYTYTVWEFGSLLAVIGVCVVAFIRTRNFRLRVRGSLLDESLLCIGLIGYFSYLIFGGIAYLQDPAANGLYQSWFAKSFLQVIMGLVQTMFIFRGLRMKACSPEDQDKMPGRGAIMFLLLVNLGMWGIDTAEMKATIIQTSQIHVYGFLAWALISHLSLPLSIFYHFHSAACLAELWQSAYKPHTD